MKTNYIKIKLGTVLVSRDDWEVAKKFGYDRDTLREFIAEEGIGQLIVHLADLLANRIKDKKNEEGS